jgi:hypothetical protein
MTTSTQTLVVASGIGILLLWMAFRQIRVMSRNVGDAARSIAASTKSTSKSLGWHLTHGATTLVIAPAIGGLEWLIATRIDNPWVVAVALIAPAIPAAAAISRRTIK